MIYFHFKGSKIARVVEWKHSHLWWGEIRLIYLGSLHFTLLHSLHKVWFKDAGCALEGYKNNSNINKSYCLQQTQNTIEKLFLLQRFSFTYRVYEKKSLAYLLTGNEQGLSKTTRSLST